MTATVIELDQEGPASILRIEGDITSASEADLMAAYGLAIANGATAVILDFSKLEYMNSGGIGLLVTLLVRAQRGRRTPGGDRPVRALPPDLLADPPRRGDRDPRRRSGGRRRRHRLTSDPEDEEAEMTRPRSTRRPRGTGQPRRRELGPAGRSAVGRGRCQAPRTTP